ncbi:MAG: hypothetical protein Q8L29_00005, partial [archaeon]|nr:hypothetical protein [archaeon]
GALTGCKEEKNVSSDILHEDAKVMSMHHEDARNQAVMIGPRIMGSRTSPEINKIKFDGRIDFEIDDKNIYEQFKKGDTADISYRENYTLIFEDLDRDGEKEQTGKTLTGYVFVNAKPKNK